MTTYSTPGIINALDYGLVPNSTADAVANVAALLAAISAAQASCATANNAQYGGVVVIPSNDEVPAGTVNGDGGVYYFAPEAVLSMVPITCYYPLLITGTGNGTKLVVTGNADLFYVDNVDAANPNANIGGVSFKDLQISYQGGLTYGAAIRVVNNSQNVRIFRIVFTDCPVAVALDQSLHANIRDCIVQNGVNTGIAISLGTTASGNRAKETHVSGCVFLAGGATSSTLGTGISVVNAEQLRVTNVRIEEFQEAITIAPGPTGGSPVDLYFEDISAFPYSPTGSEGAALLIQPNGDTSVSQVVFVGCTFGPTDQLQTEYTGAGVVIDQSLASGSAGVVDQIRFVSCQSTRWMGSGLQINGAVTNVEILGGCYSCNNTVEAPTHASGIEITTASTGTASGVRIVGADCNNSVFYDGAYLAKTQSYGVLVEEGAANISVRQCDLTDNATAPANMQATGNSIQVTDCVGYNDNATPLSTTVPGNGDTFYAYDFANYAGSVTFYVWGDATLKVNINNNPTALGSGEYGLGKGDFAKLTYSGSPSFIAIGR